jgi:hypothetical protein
MTPSNARENQEPRFDAAERQDRDHNLLNRCSDVKVVVKTPCPRTFKRMKMVYGVVLLHKRKPIK